uniref:Uncharacterized protein n=1 Tax=Anguilla anguilla TaxID=7936 RepID=A0A0E9RBA3_ANGAN
MLPYIYFGKSIRAPTLFTSEVRQVYFSFNSLHQNSSGSKAYIHQVDCHFEQSGRYQKWM